jgi:sporadic carbohydrate cluster protein (TIGR04323 family)
MSMPVPAQNSCIREFIKNKHGDYILPALESHFDNCYHQLFNLANMVPRGHSIIMYSLNMMPNEKKLDMLLSRCEEREISFAFVLEAFESKSSYKNIIQEFKAIDMHSYLSNFEEINHFLNPKLN